MKTLAAAVLSLFMMTTALVLAEEAWRNPDRLAELSLTTKLAGAPAALYFAYFARGWTTLRAQDRIGWNRLLVEAHFIGLASAGFALILVLIVTWIYSGYREDRVAEILPRGIAGAAAGGLGLAWGALWKLPKQEEVA